MAAEMYVEILWISVTSKDSKWGHQSETRLLAVNDLQAPKITIHNADTRPRVELPQPLLKKNIVEVMIGPKADDAAKDRVKIFSTKISWSTHLSLHRLCNYCQGDNLTKRHSDQIELNARSKCRT